MMIPSVDKRLAGAFMLLICLMTIPGCSVTGALKSAKDFLNPPGDHLAWDHLSFLVDESANNNSPLPVELVLVMEPELMSIVAGLSAEQWFAQRKGLLQTSPSGLIVQGIELVPGKSLRIDRTDLSKKRVLGAFLFMNFLSTADHRLTLNPKASAVIVQIGPTDSTLTPISR
jgi:type VI secretion system protein